MMVVLCLGVSSAYADLTLNDGDTHDIAGLVTGSLYVYDNVAPPPALWFLVLSAWAVPAGGSNTEVRRTNNERVVAV